MENTWRYAPTAALSKLLQVSVAYFPSEELWRLSGTTRYVIERALTSLRIGIFPTTFVGSTSYLLVFKGLQNVT